MATLDLNSITPGLTGTAGIVVGPEHTATQVGSGRIAVLATPVMINVIEAAALAAAEHLLPAGHQSLGIHLDEKIDVTKNLPGGHEINTGLKGLDWGSSKEKTGPNHMGVDMTTGGMKAPADSCRLSKGLRNSRKNRCG